MECPYCNKIFASWLSVRKHTSGCTKNDKTYCISLIYGPIEFTKLVGLSERQIKELYPNIEKSIRTFIYKRLKEIKGFGVRDISLEEAKYSVLRFVEVYSKVPTSRDTYHNKSLPTDKWCKQHYGSWNKFIEQCGLVPSIQNGYGKCTRGMDGVLYRSNLEATFVDKYLYKKYVYEYEKPYCVNRLCDFYLPEHDLYIEIAGGLRSEVILEKMQFCKNNNLKLLIFYPRQILSGKIYLP